MLIHPRLDHAFTTQISSALQALIPKYSPPATLTLSPAWNESSGATTTHVATHTIRIVLSTLETISYIASSPLLPLPIMRQLRHEWVPLLLLQQCAQVSHESQLQGAQQLRSSLLAAIALLTKGSDSSKLNTNAAAMAAAKNILGPLQQQFGAFYHQCHHHHQAMVNN